MEEFVNLEEDVSASPLYSEDLAPVTAEKRTWNTWHLAFVWVGMAVCIPTYMLASYMIKMGMSWIGALCVIGLANLVITVPMPSMPVSPPSGLTANGIFTGGR